MTQYLEPGSYVWICPVEDSAGNPHFGKGEFKPFVVHGAEPVAANRSAAPEADVVIRLMDFSFALDSLEAGRHTSRAGRVHPHFLLRVPMYSASVDYYDLLYAQFKDYAAESRRLAEFIRGRAPATTSILDVACGTGEHARQLRALGFTVDGVDLEPGFIEVARRKNPAGRFLCQDMVELSVGQTYGAVVCLFSSIGYVRTLGRLGETINRLADHVVAGGLLVVEPWFEPGAMEDGYVAMHTARDERVSICRMSVTRLQDGLSRLEFEYLIGRRGALERRAEIHELGLFTRVEMVHAFEAAGLDVEYDPDGLSGRGLYLARKTGAWSDRTMELGAPGDRLS